MIETRNPDINVDELMKRVHVEAAKLSAAAETGSSSMVRCQPAATLPPVRVLAPPPQLPALRAADSKTDRIDSMMRDARASSEGNPNIPKMFRRFFRKQGGYNRIMADAVGLLSHTQMVTNKQLLEARDLLEAQHRWLRALAEHRQADVRWMRAAAQQIADLTADVDRLVTAHQDIAAKVEGHDRVESMRREIEALGRSLRELQATVEQLQRELRPTAADKLESAATRLI